MWTSKQIRKRREMLPGRGCETAHTRNRYAESLQRAWGGDTHAPHFKPMARILIQALRQQAA
jgi:hypothetical protein